MNYTNENVRRQDRILEKQDAEKLLKNGEYGVLSLSAQDGAYGVPVSFAWDGDSRIYLHCAKSGRKIDAMKSSPDASFCIVGRTKTLPEKFSTEYESVVVKCRAKLGLDAETKLRALRLLVEKYSPDYIAEGQKYAESALQRVEVVVLEMLQTSGKARYPATQRK